MVAKHVRRRIFGLGRIQVKPYKPLEFLLKALVGPSMALEQIFQPGAFPMLPQNAGIPEDARNTQDDVRYLIPVDESVQASCEERLARKASADAQ